MNNLLTIIVVAAIGLIGVVVAYNYMQEPEPLGNRIENSINELGAGRPGEAMDELNNQTRGEKLGDDMNDMLNLSPTTN